MRQRYVHNLIIGGGAAALAAAWRLKSLGQDDLLLLTEGLNRSCSINTGSDKQTYYKMGLYGAEADSPLQMAASYMEGGAMHGDLALTEAALSTRCFLDLVGLGVPFPCDRYGQYIGYKTDHDPRRRASSCGPHTSREICLALIKTLRQAELDIVENCLAVELLQLQNRAAGAIVYHESLDEFEAILAENTIFACGGPGGLYANSVYPQGHLGSIGLALRAGAQAQNLPESQFGLGSLKFRWNLSGTYMQALPRFVSTAADGKSDAREFLFEHYKNPALMHSMIFMKGYQWPFDAHKLPQGSSQIDLLVHEETVMKKRRVFLDFRENSRHGLDFAALSPEAREYLENSRACLDTPLLRLKQMNPQAAQLYAKHGIDLGGEALEFALCAQHNNGGLAGNTWYESSNISHLFPIGEVNGSHGVVRPGGAALNAGQVGALRAAQYIAGAYTEPSLPCGQALEKARRGVKAWQGFLQGTRDWRRDRHELQTRMTKYGGHLRQAALLDKAAAEAKHLLQNIQTQGYPRRHAKQALNNCQLAFAHWVYLEAIRFQVQAGVGSRGSALVLQKDGSFAPENKDFRRLLLQTRFDGERTRSHWQASRDIPNCEGWFENVWRDFREGRHYEPRDSETDQV